MALQVEKAKQDDGLSNLSNLLGELKDMAIDMGSEIERWVMMIQYWGVLAFFPWFYIKLFTWILETYIQLITPHDNCRHNKAIDHLYVDVDELNGRVRGANQRGRRLLGK